MAINVCENKSLSKINWFRHNPEMKVQIIVFGSTDEPRHGKTGFLHMQKQTIPLLSKSQISSLQSLYFLNPKFQASSHLL